MLVLKNMFRHARLCILLFAAPLLSAAAGEYEPGMEFSAVVPGSETAMKIYLPSNYDAAKKWPLMLFYHGMNGSPTTECIVRHSEGRDFIVAGVTYAMKNTADLPGERYAAYIAMERANFRSAVQWLTQNLAVDSKRIFLGGVSQGGWTTSFIGEREMSGVAGFAILLAGRQRNAVPAAQRMAGFPVYVGAGETDPNLLSAAHAVAFYRCCGADVTFEEYAGVGHQVPPLAEGLVRWLEARGRLSHPWLETDEKNGLRDGYKKAYEDALAAPDAESVCRRLKELLLDPRLVVICGESTRDAIITKLTELAASSAPDAAREQKAEGMFYSVSWKEWKMTSIEETRDVIAGYAEIRQRAPESRWAAYAERSRERLVPVYESALRQREALKARQQPARQPQARPGMRHSTGSGGGVGIF